jgi:hypothetical protein
LENTPGLEIAQAFNGMSKEEAEEIVGHLIDVCVPDDETLFLKDRLLYQKLALRSNSGYTQADERVRSVLAKIGEQAVSALLSEVRRPIRRGWTKGAASSFELRTGRLETALRALEAIGNVATVTGLASLLGNQRITSREQREQQEFIGRSLISILTKTSLEVDEYALDAIAAALYSAVQVEIKGRRYDPSSSTEGLLVTVLERIGGEKVVTYLTNSLKVALTVFLPILASALGNLGNPRAVEPLIVLLQSNDFDVVRAACKALGRLRDSRATMPLITLLDNNRFVGEAATALGEIGDSKAIEPLSKMLGGDEDERIGRALMDLGDPRGFAPLWSHVIKGYGSEENISALVRYRGPDQSVVIATLKERWESESPKWAGDALCRMGEPVNKASYLSVCLNELPKLSEPDISRLVSYVGIDLEVLNLGKCALGETFTTQRDHAIEGRYLHEIQRLGEVNVSFVMALCRRSDFWSSCILYRIAKKKDTTARLSGWDYQADKYCMYNAGVSYENERRIAREELARRGFGTDDPTNRFEEFVGNLQGWKSSGWPDEWVKSHLSGWKHQDWLDLLEEIRRSEYWPIDEPSIGRHLETLRDQFRRVG